MALLDVIAKLGDSITNLVDRALQLLTENINEYVDEVSSAESESVSMLEFVNNTTVDTLETESQTIVGAINELNETAGGVCDVTAAGDNTFTGTNTFVDNAIYVSNTRLNSTIPLGRLYNNRDISSDEWLHIFTYTQEERGNENNPDVEDKMYNFLTEAGILKIGLDNGWGIQLCSGTYVSHYNSTYSRYMLYPILDTHDITTSLSEDSTNDQIPSAKCVYNLIGDIESLLSEV